MVSLTDLTTESRLRVRYAETDQMGVVYHANYLIWMEIGRVELCRAAGLIYRQMESEDGVFLTVAEASCRFASPARYDDQIVVKTRMQAATTRTVRFGYEIVEAVSGRELCTGATLHVFCGSSLRPSRLPAKYWPVFGIKAR